jgi:hypothetical protein
LPAGHEIRLTGAEENHRRELLNTAQLSPNKTTHPGDVRMDVTKE